MAHDAIGFDGGTTERLGIRGDFALNGGPLIVWAICGAAWRYCWRWLPIHAWLRHAMLWPDSVGGRRPYSPSTPTKNGRPYLAARLVYSDCRPGSLTLPVSSGDICNWRTSLPMHSSLLKTRVPRRQSIAADNRKLKRPLSHEDCIEKARPAIRNQVSHLNARSQVNCICAFAALSVRHCR